MPNHWGMTDGDREEARKVLNRMAESIAARSNPSHPVIEAWNNLILVCHATGEIEMGAIFGMISGICRLGDEEGRDRILADLYILLADYEHATRFNPERN